MEHRGALCPGSGPVNAAAKRRGLGLHVHAERVARDDAHARATRSGGCWPRASRAMARTSGMSAFSTPRPSAYGQQLLGHHLDELILVAHEHVAQAGHAVELRAVHHFAARVDRRALVERAPAAHGVEVLERDAHRLEDLVARRAHRVRAVHLERLPHRGHLHVTRGVGGPFHQRRHVRRRVRRRHAQERLQEPLAARDRRRAGRVRRHRHQRALAQQAAAHVERRRQRDPAELRPVDVRDAVVLGQPLVDERVVGRQQVHDAAVLVDDAAEEQLRSRAGTPARRLSSKSGKMSTTGSLAAQAADVPATGPVKFATSASDRGSASMRRTCASSTAGSFSRPARRRRSARRPECCSTGRTPGARPSARSQMRIRAAGGYGGRLRLAAIDELGIREQALQRRLRCRRRSRPPLGRPDRTPSGARGPPASRAAAARAWPACRGCRCAQAASSRAFAGLHSRILRRLAVSAAPLAPNGPSIVTCPTCG